MIYGCHADPLYGIRSLADGVRELTAFAKTRRALVLSRRAQRPWQLGVFPGTAPGQVADTVPDRYRDRRGRSCCAATVATGSAWRRCWGPSAIVASAMPSTINIGLRHILPAFPLLAVVAGIGLARLLKAPRRRSAWPSPACSCSGRSAKRPPPHRIICAYFNQLALGQPQRIVVGSDLDWGQDVRRLLTRAERAAGRSASTSPSIPAPICASTSFRRSRRCTRASRPPAGSRSASRCAPSIAPATNGSTHTAPVARIGASISLLLRAWPGSGTRRSRPAAQIQLERSAAVLAADRLSQSGAASPPSRTVGQVSGRAIAISGMSAVQRHPFRAIERRHAERQPQRVAGSAARPTRARPTAQRLSGSPAAGRAPCRNICALAPGTAAQASPACQRQTCAAKLSLVSCCPVCRNSVGTTRISTRRGPPPASTPSAMRNASERGNCASAPSNSGA